MDPLTTGALIGGGATILGGVLGSLSGSRANKQNAEAARQSAELQREFAKNGIRWKVEDAIKAGIHPLYALGANTHSFSPVSVGAQPDYSMANAVKDMGQDISRSVQATRTQYEQELSKLQLASAKLDVEGKALDNQIRASQFQKLNQATTSLPGNQDNFIPGQGNSPTVKVKAMERIASQKGRLAQEAGWRPDVSYARTDSGLTPVVPESLSESLEDDVIGKILWRVRNQLMPNITGQGAPSKSQLPPGYNNWQYDFSSQEWRPIKGYPKSPYQKLKRMLLPQPEGSWEISRRRGTSSRW